MTSKCDSAASMLGRTLRLGGDGHSLCTLSNECGHCSVTLQEGRAQGARDAHRLRSPSTFSERFTGHLSCARCCAGPWEITEHIAVPFCACRGGGGTEQGTGELGSGASFVTNRVGKSQDRHELEFLCIVSSVHGRTTVTIPGHTFHTCALLKVHRQCLCRPSINKMKTPPQWLGPPDPLNSVESKALKASLLDAFQCCLCNENNKKRQYFHFISISGRTSGFREDWHPTCLSYEECSIKQKCCLTLKRKYKIRL